MKNLKVMNQARRLRRRRRTRAKILSRRGPRPRLSVMRSNKHIAAQIIDDKRGLTLAAASDLAAVKSVKSKSAKRLTKLQSAVWVGQAIAQAGLRHQIKQVVFDRGPYAYSGRVKALVEAARAAGLEF